MRAVVVTVAWAASLIAVRVWGLQVEAADTTELALGAVPLFGEVEVQLGIVTVVASAIGALAVALVPALGRLSWRSLLAVVAASAAVWALALGAVEGWDVISGSIEADYGAHLPLVDEAGGSLAFLDTYVERQASFPVHLQAHPPGMPLLLRLGTRVGLDGGLWHVMLALAATALAAVAAVVALAEVTGAPLARRAAPFVALAPAAVWRINADAVFAGVGVAAVALCVLATGRRRRSLGFAALGGLTFGAALLLTYGAALLAVPIAAVGVHRRAIRPLLVAGVATAVIVLGPLLLGFSWFGGLAATRVQYDLSIASVRPYSYFVVANLAVAALAVGPAAVVGATRLPWRQAWPLVGGAFVALTVADVSGLSKAEVERIWQPFYPLLLLAGAGVAGSRAATRGWLAAQVAVAIAVETATHSPW